MSRGARLGLLALMVLVLVAGHLLDRELGREDSGRPGTPGAGAGAGAGLSELPLDLTDRLPAPRPPRVTGPPLPPADPASPRDERTYIVRPGDTFATIARKVYGRESAWTVIYEANRDRVPTPARLQVGITLRIPPAPPPGMRPGG